MNIGEKALALENKMVQDWSAVPATVREMAERSAAEGIPTGIAHDEELGWCMIHSGQGPYIAWSEKPDKRGI